jgi:hypothetical protein
LYEARRAIGAFASRMAREYQQSQRCPLRVASQLSMTRRRLTRWRSLASGKLRKRLFGPAMKLSIRTACTMLKRVNVKGDAY